MAAGGRRVIPTVLLLLAAAAGGIATAPRDDEHAAERRRMIEGIRAAGLKDASALAAVEAVPRHRFVPDREQHAAYEDRPLPIGLGQTISSPSIVALMTSLLDIDPGDRILEVGTGSGYQAAVLSRLAKDVYTIEIIKSLGEQARRTLADLGYSNVHVRIGDGYKGWPDAAPFDGIIVTAAPPRIPEPLLRQLKAGGKLVIPVGAGFQDLVVLTKRRDGGFDRRNVLPVLFVPMTGEAQRRDLP